MPMRATHSWETASAKRSRRETFPRLRSDGERPSGVNWPSPACEMHWVLKMPSRMLACLIILVISRPAIVCAQEDPGDRLKSEVMERWNSAIQSIRAQRYRVKYEHWHTRSPGEYRLTRVYDNQFAFVRGVGAFMLIEVADVESDGTKTKRSAEAQLANSRYSARIEKPKDRETWVLRDVTEDDKQVAQSLSDMSSCNWMMIVGMPLQRWLPDPGFRFSKVERVNGPENTMITRGHFIIDPSARPTGYFKFIESGYIDFDPAHWYRPMSFRYVHKSKRETGTTEGSMAYQQGGGIPVLTMGTCNMELQVEGKGKSWNRRIFHVTDVEYNGDIKDYEFRLSHYGLPEPMGVAWKKPTPTYVWFLAGAVVLFAVALGFRFLARRRK